MCNFDTIFRGNCTGAEFVQQLIQQWNDHHFKARKHNQNLYNLASMEIRGSDSDPKYGKNLLQV